MTGGWLNYNSEKVRDFYSSSSIIQVMKSRKRGMGGAFCTYRREGHAGVGRET